MAEALTEADLANMGLVAADHARSHLEASDETWKYLPSFRDEVARETAAMLKLALSYEHRRLSNGR